MSLLTRLNLTEKNKKEDKKIDRELPYFITIVTLLATSGFGPYTIFQKMKEITLLPAIRQESMKIIKRIDILGLDPLSAMIKSKEKIPSRQLGEFLSGYVSSIQGGGDVVNYLKSKMNSAFDRYAENERQSVSKVKALVESYMTMQVVILAVYIMVTAVASPSAQELSTTSFDIQYVLIVFPPLVSVMFIIIAHKMNQPIIKELEIKKILTFAVLSISVGVIFVALNVKPDLNPIIIGVSLIAAALWPAIKFKKKYSMGLDADAATPQILRDTAETRKAGIGPEKCVIKACKREDYNLFNAVANSIASKLEWGTSLKSIFESLKKQVQNFQVLLSFKILFEIISAGGGNVHTLESLATISEKIHNIEKSKRDLLKPYIMIGFLLMGMTSFSTLLVIDSLTNINLQSETDEIKLAQIKEQHEKNFRLFSIAIIIQSWLAGLFLGKITTGSFSGGFQHSALLVLISLVGVIAIQYSIINIETIFNFT